MKKILIAVLLTAAFTARAATTIVLDNFENGDTNVARKLYIGSTDINQKGVTGVNLGRRYITASGCDLVVSSGKLTITRTNDSGMINIVCPLQSLEAGSAGGAPVSLSSVSITYTNGTAGAISGYCFISSTFGGDGYRSYSRLSFTSGSSGTLTIPLASFSAGSDPDSIISVEFRLNGGTDAVGNFEISNIEAETN